MAKSVADLIVDLKIDGIEGVNQLKSALRGLSKAAGPADEGLEQIRRSVTAFAKAGQLSRQSIAGQIEAFKGLRQQATIGSSVYRKLGKDIDGLTQSLDKLNRKEGETARKPRSPGQIAGEFTSGIPEKTTRQLQAQQEMLQKNKISSAEYTNALVRLNSITQEFTRSQQRQVVLAGSVVAANKAAAGAAVSSQKVDISRTFTTAALKQKIAELAQDIENLEIGSKDYTTTSRQLKDAQEELNQVLGVSSKAFDDLARAQERSERRAQKIAGMQSARAGAIGTRDPRTGAMIAGGAGAPASLVQQPVREISSLYQSIGSVGMAGISADIDRMGKSYGEVANDIKKATLASNGSIRSLEAQRNSWASLRAGLNPASKSYREVGREIDKVDKRLAKLNKRRGFSAKGAAQTVGAVASAGIFGGPLGAAGALGGAAIGGAAGAAVGGGIGASFGILAQQVSGFTDYAASIRLSEKALKRLVTVENDRIKSAKNEAVATQVIEYAVAKLNVERLDATVGMTRLSAAVLGAGGNIETAGLAFLGATKAIKATKGSAEDVRGGLTALVQMFSKGKISAEELSGQLGERFPAAVTAFAEANKMSTQELQKMLKDGEVGLDKLVNFLQFAVKKYSDGALEMAASSEESGQRQTIAFQEVRRQLGEQLVSVGSELQQSITKALKDLTPAIVNIAKESAKAIKAIIDGIALLITHFDKIKDVIIILVGGAVGGKALGLIVKISASIIPLVKKVGLLRAAILILNRTLLANPLYLLAAGVTAAGVAISNYVGRHDNFIKGIENGTTSIENARAGIKKYEADLEKLQKRQDIRDGRLPEVKQRRKGGLDIQADDIVPSGQQSQILDDQIKVVESTIKKARAKLNQRIEGSKPLSEQLVGEDFLAGLLKGAKIPGLDTDPSGGGTGGADNTQDRIGRADEIVRKLRDQLKIQEAQSKVGQFIAKQGKERSDLEAKFQALLKDGANEKISQAKIDADGLLLDKQALELQARTKKLMDEATKPLEDMNIKLREKISFDKEYKRLISEGINPELANQLIKINELFEAGDKKLEQQLLDLESEKLKTDLGEAQLKNINDQIDAIKRRRKAEKGKKEDAEGSAGEAYADPSFMDTLRDKMRALYDEATNLNEQIANVGVKAVGDFADAFVELAMTGKSSFRELTVSILQDLAKIIMRAAILQAFKTIVPGLFAADGAVTKDATPVKTAANGLAVARNGIVPYAKGGLVTKPTLFQYKQGGVGNYGLMGEAGTEAIMPLRRGANGRLGVEASGGGVSNVVVNVDASGSNVQGDQPNAKALGSAIGAAVQAELVKQKRPGGLLS